MRIFPLSLASLYGTLCNRAVLDEAVVFSIVFQDSSKPLNSPLHVVHKVELYFNFYFYFTTDDSTRKLFYKIRKKKKTQTVKIFIK